MRKKFSLLTLGGALFVSSNVLAMEEPNRSQVTAQKRDTGKYREALSFTLGHTAKSTATILPRNIWLSMLQRLGKDKDIARMARTCKDMYALCSRHVQHVPQQDLHDLFTEQKEYELTIATIQSFLKQSKYPGEFGDKIFQFRIGDRWFVIGNEQAGPDHLDQCLPTARIKFHFLKEYDSTHSDIKNWAKGQDWAKDVKLFSLKAPAYHAKLHITGASKDYVNFSSRGYTGEWMESYMKKQGKPPYICANGFVIWPISEPIKGANEGIDRSVFESKIIEGKEKL
ncbi:MAG: hypothetical protein JSR85_00525 [Proteobacteria bacterium]|nr:hypothetical protein [Pseudomonadota bacterium]